MLFTLNFESITLYKELSMKWIFPLAFIFSVSHANEAPLTVVDASEVRIQLDRPLFIEFSNKSWNKDSKSIDSGRLLLRDSQSQQVYLVEMRETNENSSTFKGQYQLDANTQFTQATVQVFIPPQGQDASEKIDLKKLVQDGVATRKPYFFRIQNKEQRITVFNSKDQALEAYRYFIRSGQSAQVVNPNLLETQARAQLEKQKLDDIKKQAENKKLIASQALLLEKQMQERIEAQKLMDQAQKQQKKLKAQDLANQALTAYNEEKFDQASQLFDQALELDPENQSFYFQYGVSLYRIDKYEKSTAYLNQVPKSELDNQKYLFLGLNHLKLQNWDLAFNSFEQIKNDKDLGPTANFYLGIIDFSNEKLETSQKYFEQVLDTSNDAKMDQAAENYIEQILNLKRYRELQSKKWTLTGNLGMSYDSNILTVSPNIIATDLAGFRTNYGVNLEFRPVYTEKHEFLGQISFSDIYSMSSSFQAKSEFQNVDPQSMGFILPYRWKGSIGNRTAQIGVTPSLRQTVMNADQVGGREIILQSTGVTTDLTLVQSEKLTGIYALELRSDDSKTISADEDKQDALFMGFNSTFTYFFDDQNPSKAYLFDAGVGLNNATGINQKYTSVNLGAGLLQPGLFKALWITKINVTQKAFTQHVSRRADTLLTATLLMQKQIKEKLQASGIFMYNQNISNISSLAYDQFMLMGQLTWQTSF